MKITAHGQSERKPVRMYELIIIIELGIIIGLLIRKI